MPAEHDPDEMTIDGYRLRRSPDRESVEFLSVDEDGHTRARRTINVERHPQTAGYLRSFVGSTVTVLLTSGESLSGTLNTILHDGKDPNAIYLVWNTVQGYDLATREKTPPIEPHSSIVYLADVSAITR